MPERTPNDYQPPVADLLHYGELKSTNQPWADYLTELELTETHIPELIRMMTDDALWESDFESSESWSVAHAWRALAQLQAEEAIAPFLSMLEKYEDDDWIHIDAPEVFELIGEAALPKLTEYLASNSYSGWTRFAIAEGIEHIAKRYPQSRETCVSVLVKQLEKYAENGPHLNGMLVSSLIKLEAVEAAPLIERVYADKQIDDMVAGTWATVQVDLGLKSKADFSEEEFQPQFIKNLQAAALLRNPEYDSFEDSFSSRNPVSWGIPLEAPARFGEGFLEVPKSATKPVQGFGQVKSNKKGKKKK
jgi:HEAT repeat protein